MTLVMPNMWWWLFEESLVKCKISLVGWRGAQSCRLYINKHDRVHFLHLIGEDLSIGHMCISTFELLSYWIHGSKNKEWKILVNSQLGLSVVAQRFCFCWAMKLYTRSLDQTWIQTKFSIRTWKIKQIQEIDSFKLQHQQF